MRTNLVFGNQWIEVELPDTAHIIRPGYGVKLPPAESLDGELQKALENPVDEKLGEKVKPNSKVTIAFDDPTVPCFAPVWENAILKIVGELKKAGVAMGDITLLCANALHRKFRISELEKILGSRVVNAFRDRIICHDAEDAENIIRLGETPSGYDVEVNRRLVDSDLTIYVNTMSTAFNGGWKSICVGLSTWRSIRWHHTPDKMTMSLERNPMHEVLNEMGKVVESECEIFKVETMLANPLQISKIFTGSVDGTRRKVLEILRSHSVSRRKLLDEKADIVCYGVPDWSPYAAFSFMNPILTLISTGLGYLGGVIEGVGKKGCSVIMATPCREQWDEIHHASYREVWNRILSETKDPDEVMERYEDEFQSRKDYIAKYRFEYSFHPLHGLMATYPLKRLRHAERIFVAGIENPEIAKHLDFIPTKSFEDALEEAISIHGKDAVIACIQYPMMVNRQ
jgi:nickel-dependent lactate racemase